MHAHFQPPIPKLNDLSTLKFKKNDATTSQKKVVVPYHRFPKLQENNVLVRELCYLDMKGGDFDDWSLVVY